MMDGFCELDAPLTRLLDGVDQGEHLGGQLFVWHAGQVVADCAVGDAQPGVTMRTDSVVNWMSAGKPITAWVTLNVLAEAGLPTSVPVAEVWPEFANRDKQNVTVEHVLMHTAGLRGGPARTESRIDTLNRIVNMKIEPRWVLGETAGYSPAISWDILAECVRRLTELSMTQAIGQYICKPFGIDPIFVGIDESTQHQLGERLAGRYDMTEDGVRPAFRSHMLAYERPGGNTWGTTRSLGQFYAKLLQRHKDANTSDAPITQITQPARVGQHDKTFVATIDWSRGCMLQSWHHQTDYPYNFGPHASRTAFGHGGSQTSMGLADPERELAFAWVVNGQPGEPRHQQRNLDMNTLIYNSLGLANPT